MAQLPKYFDAGGRGWRYVSRGLYRTVDKRFAIYSDGSGVFRWQLWKLGESRPRHETETLATMLKELKEYI